MLADLLKVANLLEDCNFSQITRTDDWLSRGVLDDYGDCFRGLDVDIMPVEHVDGQFEWIALWSSHYGQLANPFIEELLYLLIRKLLA